MLRLVLSLCLALLVSAGALHALPSGAGAAAMATDAHHAMAMDDCAHGPASAPSGDDTCPHPAACMAWLPPVPAAPVPRPERRLLLTPGPVAVAAPVRALPPDTPPPRA